MQKDDVIYRQAAIDAIEHRLAEPAYLHTGEDWYVGMNCAESEIYELPSAQPDNRLTKIADLMDGTIDHFDLDDAMDLLYQIKGVLKDG